MSVAHKSIIQCYDLCEDQENFYFVREYIGSNLLTKIISVSDHDITFGEDHAALIVH
jgi:serine/threonine protein kinase